MTQTTDVIARLSQEAQAVTPMRTPRDWAVRLLFVLAIYGVVSQAMLGIRADLWIQFSRPLFSLEIILLALLILLNGFASMLSMYPDAYQKKHLLFWPLAILAMLLGLIACQFVLAQDIRMVIPAGELAHTKECAICVASLALIPSAFMFALLRKGAPVHLRQAGIFTVLAASGIGCLTLRLSEANDSIMHLALWHYIPTLLFAVLGAFCGRMLLRW
ncbi:MAG: DUF1109 domain-containing protein [Rickettsiales bacterium]|nr:DUF1109 domain-containing protein [Rickettsiales bacterium]